VHLSAGIEQCEDASGVSDLEVDSTRIGLGLVMKVHNSPRPRTIVWMAGRLGTRSESMKGFGLPDVERLVFEKVPVDLVPQLGGQTQQR
jgi:hypothetical protein